MNKKQNTTKEAIGLFARPGFRVTTVFQPIKELSAKILKDFRCRLSTFNRGCDRGSELSAPSALLHGADILNVSKLV